MGYDLHATRAEHWTKTAGLEISATEWKEIVTGDDDLNWDRSHGPHAVVWVDGEGKERGWFDWYDGVVYTTDPDRATVEKLLELASRMEARVQGDGGEFYERIEDWETGQKERRVRAMTTAKAGDRVRIHYTGRFLDGTEFDTTQGRDPLGFQVGGDEVIPGLSQGVVGMTVGEERTLTVSPEEAYGQRDEGLKVVVPRGSLPQEVEPGDALKGESDRGTFICWVAELNDQTATLDRNHPLAGATLVFDVTLVSIEE